MLGVTLGEYLPCTPSFTASWPLAPEYLGKSYLPPSSAKCRWPWPALAGLPTVDGLSVKPVSFTVAVSGPLTDEPSAGLTKLTDDLPAVPAPPPPVTVNEASALGPTSLWSLLAK